MKVLPVNNKILLYLKEHQLSKKFEKQVKPLEQNPRHRSLNFELLEPKDYNVYSFRIDRKYRAILIFKDETGLAEIIKITSHYH